MIQNVAALPQAQLPPLGLDSGASSGSVDDAAPVSVVPLDRPAGDASLGFGSLLEALNAGGAQLDRAESAENDFAAGTGGLQEMVFERAKADSLVSVAAAAGSRVAQSLNTLAQMQL